MTGPLPIRVVPEADFYACKLLIPACIGSMRCVAFMMAPRTVAARVDRAPATASRAAAPMCCRPPQHFELSQKTLCRTGPVRAPETAAETSVARLAVRQLEKIAQKWLLRFREERPVYRASTATRDRAEGDHKKLQEACKSPFSVSRVLRIIPALCYFAKANSACDTTDTTRTRHRLGSPGYRGGWKFSDGI